MTPMRPEVTGRQFVSWGRKHLQVAIAVLTFSALVSAQTITSLSPTSGPVGTTVTVSGSGFGATQGSSYLNFKGVAAHINSWSATSIVAVIPSSLIPGTASAKVWVGGVGSNEVAFTVTPGITSLSPNSGVVGTSVTITGTNFGSTQGTSTVTFNGTTATPSSWNATSIVVPVPTGATTGNVVVTVGGTASNGVSFTVNSSGPGITSLSPTSGPVGTSVTITGTNFGSTQGSSTVMFNGATATPSSWSATSIAVPVPSGATTGNVVVTVGGHASNGVSFTVTPHITSLSPTSGATGTSVTISGTTFGSTQGSSTVTFNGTSASPTSWSATSIAVPVPNGATTGNVVVTVGGQASNSQTYTVTPHISNLSPTSGIVGTSVTITGTTFGSTQGASTVTFNGTTATPTSWSATSIVAPVPSSATTGNVAVTVGGQASNGVSFTVTTPAPSISSLSPSSGPETTSVTITGSNFGSTQGTSTVTFNGTMATPTSWGATSIVVPVPSGATTGNVVVTVGGQASGGVSFTVTPHISNLSPTSGQIGASVTISGTTFGSTQGTVAFNGTGASVSSWNPTSIVTTVPSGATTGNVVVTAGGQSSNGVPFTVNGPAPAISSISPNPAPAGRAVYITGSNFGSSGTVTFGGVTAVTTSWSSTLISAVVPNGAPTGNVVVTVAGQASGGYSFTVGTAVENLVTGTTYDMVNYQTTVSFGSGDSDVYTYDSHTGRMTKYQFNVGGQAVVGALGWNPNGSLGALSITDPLNSANNQNCSYTHDDLARIENVNCTNASTNVWNQAFAYDAFGNISKTSTGPGITFPGSLPAQAYSSSSNWLTSIPGCSPTYDAVGDMTNDCVHNYGWDAEGKMISVDANITVVYDALGRMVEKNVSGTVTQIVYGPTGAKMAIMSRQVLQKALIQLPAGATAVYTSTGLVYRHSDHLGSSRLATTSIRTLYASVAYAPYGEPYAQAGATDLSFTGQDQDTVSGLHDFLDRKYSPVQGRWLSPDPAGLAAVNMANPQTWNRYAYVMNNPLRLIDPLGDDCYDTEDDGGAFCDDSGGLGDLGFGSDPNPSDSDPNSVPTMWYQNVTVTADPVNADLDPIAVLWYDSQLGGVQGSGNGGSTGFAQARNAVLTILNGKNPCSAYLNGGKGSAQDIMSNVPILLISASPGPLSPADARTDQGPDGPIEVAADGRFYANSKNGIPIGSVPDADGNPTGGYRPGSYGARMIILLHELAHKVDLIPRDGTLDPGGPKQSDINTQDVMKHCAATVGPQLP